jgi:hypothetical protein
MESARGRRQIFAATGKSLPRNAGNNYRLGANDDGRRNPLD